MPKPRGELSKIQNPIPSNELRRGVKYISYSLAFTLEAIADGRIDIEQIVEVRTARKPDGSSPKGRGVSDLEHHLNQLKNSLLDTGFFTPPATKMQQILLIHFLQLILV